jgi:hypothetical protein
MKSLSLRFSTRPVNVSFRMYSRYGSARAQALAAETMKSVKDIVGLVRR